MAQTQSTPNNTPLALTRNYGYFCTAIRELIPKRRGLYGRDFDENTLTEELAKLFLLPGYGFETVYALATNLVRNVTTYFMLLLQKWHPASARKNMTLATSEW